MSARTRRSGVPRASVSRRSASGFQPYGGYGATGPRPGNGIPCRPVPLGCGVPADGCLAPSPLAGAWPGPQARSACGLPALGRPAARPATASAAQRSAPQPMAPAQPALLPALQRTAGGAAAPQGGTWRLGISHPRRVPVSAGRRRAGGQPTALSSSASCKAPGQLELCIGLLANACAAGPSFVAQFTTSASRRCKPSFPPPPPLCPWVPSAGPPPKLHLQAKRSALDPRLQFSHSSFTAAPPSWSVWPFSPSASAWPLSPAASASRWSLPPRSGSWLPRSTPPRSPTLSLASIPTKRSATPSPALRQPRRPPLRCVLATALCEAC